jgi:putative transcriptional regulator
LSAHASAAWSQARSTSARSNSCAATGSSLMGITQAAEKEFRDGHRVTFDQIASATGVHRTTLSKLANQRGYNTTTDVLDKLCTFFRVPLSDLASSNSRLSHDHGRILATKWSQHSTPFQRRRHKILIYKEKPGRGKRIRTSGPCLPKTVLYQAELFPDRWTGRTWCARQGFGP